MISRLSLQQRVIAAALLVLVLILTLVNVAVLVTRYLERSWQYRRLPSKQ